MSIETINNSLKLATRPIEFFGNISKEEVKKKYRMCAKYCHPDLVSDELKPLASETIVLLNEMYKKAEDELESGIYDVTDPKELYKRSKPSVEFKVKGKDYKFYEYVFNTDIADVYRGLEEDNIVYLKICKDENDNELLESEYKLLKSLNHYSIPKVIDMVKINGQASIIEEDYKGYTLESLIKEYGPIPGKHVAWMLERMLSCIGYLHEKLIINGNIKPDNVIVDPLTHNVLITDYSLSVTNANESSSKYKIINDDYTPSYVSSKSKVIPNADIYAVGKIAIYLLGGDVKRNAMPVSCDVRLRNFIRKLVNETDLQNDAYSLWNELIELRNEVYGNKKFQTLEKKII